MRAGPIFHLAGQIFHVLPTSDLPHQWRAFCSFLPFICEDVCQAEKGRYVVEFANGSRKLIHATRFFRRVVRRCSS